MMTFLARIESHSRPGIKHRIFMTNEGVLCCTCEDFMERVWGRPVYRTCIHIDEFLGTDTPELVSPAERLVVEHAAQIIARLGHPEWGEQIKRILD